LQAQNEELHEQLDDASAAQGMVEKLAEENLALNEVYIP